MASKVKRYNYYIVIQRKTRHSGLVDKIRFIVTAKTEKEAEQFVRNKIDKTISVKVYFKIPEHMLEKYLKDMHNTTKLNYGVVIKEEYRFKVK